MKNNISNLVLNSTKFQRWKQRVEANGIVIKKIEVLANISRGQINTALLDCLLITPEGTEIPRFVFMGGDSVVIIPVLTCCEDNEVYTLMVNQRRIVDGDYSTEFPAGTVDLLQDDPRAMACQELREELSLTISHDELIPLTTDPVKEHPSLADGRAYFFYFTRKVPFSFLEEMDGIKTGCREDHEYISIKVVKMSEVVNCRTPSALIGIKLLERALNRIF